MKLFKQRKKNVSNVEFWNSNHSIEACDSRFGILWYEKYLIDLFIEKKNTSKVEQVIIIGCGTGREIYYLKKIFPNAKIIANDISIKMLERCKKRLKNDSLEKNVDIIVGDAKEISRKYSNSDLIIIFNSVLNYILPLRNRVETITHLKSLLKNSGSIIGVAHNRFGRIDKTIYFLFKGLFAKIGLIKDDPGDRYGGFGGIKFPNHYFTSSELLDLFKTCSLNEIDVMSLSECSKIIGKQHNRWRSYNQLIFYAQK